MSNGYFSPAVARVLFLAISVIAIVYHVLILTGVVDFRYAWGGRLKGRDEMIQMESFSILIQVLLMAIVLWTPRVVKRGPRLVLGVTFFLLGFLFLLNTAGNLMALTAFERYAFTPMTLLASICAFRMALPLFRRT